MANMLRHPDNIERALAFLNVYADEVRTDRASVKWYSASGRIVAQYYPSEPLLFVVNGLGI